MVTAAPTTRQTPVGSPPRPVHHVIDRTGGSRVSLCGRIPPWDGLGCVGDWHGESHCPECGEPMCPACLRIAKGDGA